MATSNADAESATTLSSHTGILIASTDACGSESDSAALPSNYCITWEGIIPTSENQAEKTHQWSLFIIKDPHPRIGATTYSNYKGIWSGSPDSDKVTNRIVNHLSDIKLKDEVCGTVNYVVRNGRDFRWATNKPRLGDIWDFGARPIYQTRDDKTLVDLPSLEFLTAENWDNATLPPQLIAVIEEQVSLVRMPLGDMTFDPQATALLEKMRDEKPTLPLDFDRSRLIAVLKDDNGQWSVW